jgi:2',3'-cyclic-nucleotide 2'-phosphodiesterase/3'-nucleotidase
MLPLLLAVSLVAQVPDSAHLVLVATADVHGHATAWDYLAHRPYGGGLARVAAAVDSLRRRYPGQVIVVDAGDLLEGSPLAEYHRRVGPPDPDPLIESMNLVGYDAATPGDQDLEAGVSQLREAVGGAAFPWVSANLRLEPAGTPAFRPYAVLRRAGVRVGVVGFTAADRERLLGARLMPIDEVAGPVFLPLRREADLVVALVHVEPTDSSTATPLAGSRVRPDLIVLGGSRHTARPALGGVPVVQPKPDATELAVVHLDLVRDRGGWRITRLRTEPLELGRVAPSPLLEQRLAPIHAAVQAWVDEPLGLATAPMTGSAARVQPTPLLDLVLEAERRASGARLASAALPDLRSGFAGDSVRRSDLLRLYPLDYTLRAVRVSGAQLREYLEWSARYFHVDPVGRISLEDSVPGADFEVVRGARYDIDLRRAAGDRIVGLSVGGRPVTPADSFTLALNNRRAAGAGGYGMVRGAPVVYDRGEPLYQVLEAEVTHGGIDPTARPASEWRIVPEGAVVAVRNLFGLAGPPLARSPTDSVAFRLMAVGELGEELPAWAGGLERAMDSLGAACNCPTLRLDAGGSLDFTPVLAALGFAAGVPALVDFDQPLDTLRESGMPWLVANLTDSAGGRPGSIARFRVVDTAGVRVAFLGYVTPEVLATQSPERLRGLRLGEGELALHAALSEIRRSAPGLTVLMAYAGATCDTLACEGEVVRLAEQLRGSGVDLIVVGQGTAPMETRVGGIPIIGPGGPGGLAVADVVKTAAGGREVRVRVERIAAAPARPGTPLATVLGRVQIRSDSTDRRVVARLKRPLERGGPQDAVGGMVAEARRNAAHADLGLVQDASIRGGLAAGPVTLARLREVEPAAEPLVLIRLNGGELRGLLERTLTDPAGPSVHLAGAIVRYDPRASAGRRVRSVALAGGRKLRTEASYTLVTDDATASGVGDLLPGGRPAERLGIRDVDAVATYLRRLPQPVELGASMAYQPTRR